MRRRDYQNPGLTPSGLATGGADQALARRLVLRSLWSGLGLQVVSTEWHRALHAERSEYRPDYAAIEIMRTGAFEKRTGRERLLADAGMVVFHEPGEGFEIRHPCGVSNRGTTLRIRAEAQDEMCAARGGATRGGGLFRSRWAPSPAPFALAAHRLAGWAADDLDALACEEAVVLLIDAALELDARQHAELPARGDAASRARTVQAFLNESFAQPLRLPDVARAADCSVWHVSKQFRRAMGVTIHAWLTRLRLRHALEALHDGAVDLTRLALDVGFSSHSHFSAAFRAEFGVTPRAARRLLARRR